jgi:endonuclease G
MRLQKSFIEPWEGEAEDEIPSTSVLRATRSNTSLTRPDLEVLNRRARFLSAEGQTPTTLELEALQGTNDLLDVNFLDRCLLACRAICRLTIEAQRGRTYATGFLVAPGLLLTNHHVLSSPEIAGRATIEFGYRYNTAGILERGSVFRLSPEKFYISDKKLDYAVVAVQPESETGHDQIAKFGYLRLIAESGKVQKGEFVTIIQHPDGAPLQIALRENEVIKSERDDFTIWYRADTAHGSSGSPVFNDSLQIAALHSSGRIKRNDQGEYALSAGGYTRDLDGLSETDVVWEANVGIRISQICNSLIENAKTSYPDFLEILEVSMAGGDLLSEAVASARMNQPGIISEDIFTKEIKMTANSDPNPFVQKTVESAMPTDNPAIVIPLHLRVTLESPLANSLPMIQTEQKSKQPTSQIEAEARRMQIPVIYDGLEERDGYDPDFLELGPGKSIPLPILSDSGKKIAAPLLDGGGYELRYHKFSIVMHKERRLALLTASNVDWREASKQIDGKRPTRRALTEIPEGVAEQWVTDERIDSKHQLPDIFFSEDRGAFDKGHLVRRDDVCWGSSFEDIQMANGDTFHVTNCSPQTSAFNQSSRGEDNWGDFEDEVERITKSEKVIIFSGPVLEPKDRWFRGRDENGPVRIQIPQQFWKIVVSKGPSGPEAYGFVLEQDVRRITEEEFAVSRNWVKALKRISDIEKLLRGWVDLTSLKMIDQFNRVGG